MPAPKGKYKKSRDTISAIVASTRKLLEAKGYSNLTVRDICTEAGVSTGSFYTHFSSKEELLTTVFMDTRLGRKNLDPENFAHGDCKTRLQNFIKQYGWMNMSNEPEELKQILSFDNPIYTKKRHFEDYVIEILTQGIECGEVKSEFSAERLADILMVCLRGCSHEWCRKNGSYDLADQMVQCAWLLFASVWTAPNPVIPVYCEENRSDLKDQ